METQRQYARVVKRNSKVTQIWQGTEEQCEPEYALGYDVDITNHAQKDEIAFGWYHDNETNTFSEYPKGYIPPEPEPSLEEQLAALKEENQTLMLAIAEQYEKQLAAEENQQIIMLAIAELYETQTSAAL